MLDGWLSCLEAFKNMGERTGLYFHVPQTSGRYLNTGKDFPAQKGHKYFVVTEGKSYNVIGVEIFYM